MDRRIEEIINKEKAFNEIISAIKDMNDSLNHLENEISKYEVLLDYYTSADWRKDLDYSNSDEFPKNIPHGILSQDAFFEEIGNFRALAIRMLKVGTKMIEI